MLTSLSLAAGSSLFDASPLFGYLDPGSGSMLLQIVAAGALSSLFFVKSTVLQVRCWLSGGRATR